MGKQNQSIFKKTYLTVSPAAASYYKQVWLKLTKLSERSFRHRLNNPELFDLLLFSHVCKVDLGIIVMPLNNQFKNIPAFNETLQLSIETT